MRRQSDREVLTIEQADGSRMIALTPAELSVALEALQLSGVADGETLTFTLLRGTAAEGVQPVASETDATASELDEPTANAISEKTKSAAAETAATAATPAPFSLATTAEGTTERERPSRRSEGDASLRKTGGDNARPAAAIYLRLQPAAP